jgi:hypothetical protein
MSRRLGEGAEERSLRCASVGELLVADPDFLDHSAADLEDQVGRQAEELLVFEASGRACLYAWVACVRVIPSETRPSLVPDSRPLAAGQRGTLGTGIAIPLLVSGRPARPSLDAVTVQVILSCSSEVWTVYPLVVAPTIGVPSRAH